MMQLAGPQRSVYWLSDVSSSEPATEAEAARYPNLEILDVVAQIAAHPAWGDGGRLNADGLTGVRDFIQNSIGLDGWEQPVGSTGSGCEDGFDGYGSIPVPACGFQLPRGNPRSCQDAVRWALAQTDGPTVWHRRCLHFVARAYGWAASGTSDASQFWGEAPTKHPGDPNPPAGALVFWSTAGTDGHVAISTGTGMVISNDIGGAGSVAAVPLTEIADRWHAIYLGWAPPFFARGL
jgi:hypothetical protein